MSTELLDFSNEQDSLVILLDDQPEENEMGDHLKRLFPKQQYIYLRNQTLNGVQMVDLLRTQIREQYATLPKGNRMLFCWYLPLVSLTQEWMDHFFEIADAVRRFMPPLNMFDQHYMLCFNYETGSLTKEEWERIFQLLHELAKRKHSEISHHVYLLRSVGVETFENQEKGIVQLAHLLSRKDYYRVDTPGDTFSGYLKMVMYADYYENRVAHCQERLEELQQWLEGESDPEFTKLQNLIRYQNQSVVNELKRATSGFRRRKGLFPASVKDYKGNLITGYKSTISDDDRRIVARQHDYLRDICIRLRESVDLSETIQLVREEYTYRDCMNLQKALRDGTFLNLLKNGLDTQGVEDDSTLILEGINDRFAAQAAEVFGTLEAGKKSNEQKQREYKKELNKAGTYESLEACLRYIDEDTRPPLLNGHFAEHTDTIALISGNCLGKWHSQMLEIRNVDRAFRYSRKDEDYCEIAIVKESDITNLTDENAVSSLERLFGGE